MSDHDDDDLDDLLPVEVVEPCPDCGLDPDDDTLHRDGCPRVNTCGQFGPPWRAGPWHPTPTPFTVEWVDAHRPVCETAATEGSRS